MAWRQSSLWMSALSPFVSLCWFEEQLSVQVAEDVDQIVVRAAGPVIEFFPPLVEGAHPPPVRPRMPNHRVAAEDGTRVVGKFKFQHDIDDATATLVGENGLRRWHCLIPVERDGVFASGRLEIPGRFDRPALGML